MKHTHYSYLFLLLFIASFSQAQNLEWVGQYTGEEATIQPGTTTDDWTLDVLIDLDGNIVTSGYVAGQADVDFSESEFLVGTPNALSFYISKYDPDGNLLWAIPTITQDHFYSPRSKMAIGPDNSIYFLENFQESLDIDPGPGETIVSPVGGSDILLVKYDGNGNFIWAIPLGTSDTDAAADLTIDSEGNVILLGHTLLPIDLDPGPGEAMETPPADVGFSMFVARYTPSGEYIWSAMFDNLETPGAFNFNNGYTLDTDAQNNIYLGGTLLGIMDADPGPDVYTLESSAPGGDNFIMRLTAEGAFDWGFTTNGMTLDVVYDLKTDGENFLYATGYLSEGQTDMDPGPGEYWLTVEGFEEAYLAKYSLEGELIWAFSLGSINHNRSHGLDFTPENNIIIGGQVTEPFDADPGPDVVMLSPETRSGFICTYTPDMEYLHSMAIDGNSESSIFSAAVGLDGAYYAVGMFRKTADFDPGSGTCLLHVDNEVTNQNFSADGFLAKFTTWCIPADELTLEADSLSLCFGEQLIIEIPDSVRLNNSCCWALYKDACGQNLLDSNAYGLLETTVTESGYYYVGAKGSCPGDQLCDSIYVDVSQGIYVLPDANICLGDSALIFGEYQTEAGLYEAFFMDQNGCDSLVQQSLITWYFVPDMNVSGDSLIAGGGESWQWIDCSTGTPIAGATDQIFIPTESGLYNVAITLGDCTFETDCVLVEIPVSSHSILEREVSIYPNPTNGLFHIESTQANLPIRWEVIGWQGQHILSGAFDSSGRQQIDLSAYPAGVYFVKLYSEDSARSFRLVRQ
ncbi:MAG: T9SS type A sorting domain-containing protein [Bacteroidetes bacterium]|nr:T9SS type A sorting domain-containing protein [Bacteroidota bacterium]